MILFLYFLAMGFIIFFGSLFGENVLELVFQILTASQISYLVDKDIPKSTECLVYFFTYKTGPK